MTKTATKKLPMGAIPYSNVSSAAKMQAKLFEDIPYLPIFPLIDEKDSIVARTFAKIPGIKLKENKYVLNPNTDSYKNALVKLDKAYNHCSTELLEPYAIDSVFLEKFFQLIKKFKSPNACINFIGPFSISQILKNNSEEQFLLEKSFRKLFIQLVCVKALWVIDKIKEISPNTVPIIIFEEPMAGRFGNVKRENEGVNSELITHMYERIVEKIKSAGALVAVHSNEKCDWKIPINAGVDIISFDAYNNPNNLCIMPDTIIDFIARGGKINWCIVPVMTEAMVKGLNIDYLESRLRATMEGLILAGVPQDFVYKSALVSVQGDVNHLPVIFAEKALILTSQLAARLKSKF